MFLTTKLVVTVCLCFALFETSSVDCGDGICPVGEELNEHTAAQLISVQWSGQHAAHELKQSTSRKSSSYYSLVASSHSEISAKINKFISSHTSVSSVVSCYELSAMEIASLASKLRVFTDTSMTHFFPEDDGRQLHLNPWEIHESEEDSMARRAAQCAETVKLWAHHTPNSVKASSMNVVLPSLPTHDFNKSGNITELQNEAALYNKSLSCVAGHTVRDIELDASTSQDPYEYDWPRWPSIMHFQAKGYGPYPFWQFGLNSPNQTDNWTLNLSFDTPSLYSGNEMEVWHNTLQKATKFYHSSCRWDWIGFSEFGTQPCVGLMLNGYGANGAWYLYTADSETMASDGKFCCESTWRNTNGMNLGTINRNFVDEMIYWGEADFRGYYYDGRSKRYIMSMNMNTSCPECGNEPSLPINVFYETDMEGRPLRFGEWGQKLVLDGYLHDTDFPLLYEEMDPESFTDRTMQNFSGSVFDVPQVCTVNPGNCHPGRMNRASSTPVKSESL